MGEEKAVKYHAWFLNTLPRLNTFIWIMGTVRYFVTCNWPPLSKFNSLCLLPVGSASISIHSDAYILVNSFVCPSPENTWPPYKHNQKQKIESRLRLSQKKRKKDETCQNGWIEKETCALSEFLNCSNAVTFN